VGRMLGGVRWFGLGGEQVGHVSLSLSLPSIALEPPILLGANHDGDPGKQEKGWSQGVNSERGRLTPSSE